MKDAQLAKAFRVVRRYLWDGCIARHKFEQARICDALFNAWCDGKLSERTCDRARILVMRRLDGALSLRYWLQSQGIPYDDLTIANVQAHRLAWCKLLEAEFKE